jgi:ABC-type multidrug transport system fused ATPase/permease subunit
MYINSTPFIFTSSIRENLDPFSEHSEEEIVEALKKVKLWEAIEV